MDAVCQHHNLNYKLFCDGSLIKRSEKTEEPVLLLETFSTTELVNLKLATELEDVVYLPPAVRQPRIIKRVDEILGLEVGSISPCPASLPFADPEYFSRKFVEIEREHQVRDIIKYTLLSHYKSHSIRANIQ